MNTNPCTGQGVMIGLKAGVGFSELYYSKGWKVSSVKENDWRLINFAGGFTINLQIAEKWSFHSEILFEDKGDRFHYYSDSDRVEGIWRKNVEEIIVNHNYYLHFPQTIRYEIQLSKKGSDLFYLEGGPYFAFYLSSKEVNKYKFDGTEKKDISYYDLTGISTNVLSWNQFDWGAKVGMGILLIKKKGTFDFNISDEQMLKSFTNVIDNTKSYFNVISITIGYSLPVAKMRSR
jgi:hypothetical protein